ncbi:MAG: AraC family transcriptional regulator ligand-binding domain-containing protein [Pseudomonadota bacterium]
MPALNRYMTDISVLFAEMLLKYGVRPEAIAGPEEEPEQHSRDPGSATANISGSALLQASRLTGDPEFCLKLGEQMKLTHFGIIGFAIMSCETLEDVLRLLIRYHPILDLGSSWRFTKTDTAAKLIMNRPPIRPEFLPPLVEATFSSLATLGKDLIGVPLGEVTFDVSYASPPHANSYQQYLYSSTNFNQSHCEITLPLWLLERSVRTASPVGHVVFRQQCETLLRGFNQSRSVSWTVRRLVMEAGRRGYELAWVAKELAYSERTLRRRLAEEGTSFRVICDEVRNVLATNYLTSTQLTVIEIAELLVYTDPASFRRAFKRLNGLTPLEYRERNGNASLGAGVSYAEDWKNPKTDT